MKRSNLSAFFVSPVDGSRSRRLLLLSLVCDTSRHDGALLTPGLHARFCPCHAIYYELQMAAVETWDSPNGATFISMRLVQLVSHALPPDHRSAAPAISVWATGCHPCSRGTLR